MIQVELPGCSDIRVYLKDESTHPSGSLKHRLARSLFLYGLCNGWIDGGTTIVEASSGSTAVSEAYFARLLGLPFIAVVPKCTSRQKIEQIQFYDGKCHLVDDPASIMDESRRLAASCNGHFMDQFTFAERATDWRGNNNIAESLFDQLMLEPHPDPRWVVVGAGTGGTSATIGRYIRYFQRDTRLCVVDPDGSVFFDYFRDLDPSVQASGSRIEGIGRPCVPTSFLPSVVDRMVHVPDRWSIAAMMYLEEVLGRRCGASTGTNLIGVIECVAAMQQQGIKGSVVSLICDSGQRYCETFYDPEWLAKNDLEPTVEIEALRCFFDSGVWQSPCRSQGVT